MDTIHSQNRATRWLIGLSVLLGVIVLVEAGMILSSRRTADGEKQCLLAKLLPDRWMPAAKSRGHPLAHNDRIVLLESEQDLDAIHEQINRLFSGMAAAGRPAQFSFFGPAGIRPSAMPWTDRMLQLQREVDRIFEDAFHDTDIGDLPVQLEQGWNMCAVSSSLHLEDQGSNILVKLALPGVDASAIAINLQGRLLTITANQGTESPSPDGGYAQRQQFTSKLRLPGPVDADAAQAFYQDGVLRIVIPKNADQEPLAKVIKVI